MARFWLGVVVAAFALTLALMSYPSSSLAARAVFEKAAPGCHPGDSNFSNECPAGTLTVTAAPGEANDLLITRDAGGLVVQDRNAPLAGGMPLRR